jgi:hypothetical protein
MAALRDLQHLSEWLNPTNIVTGGLLVNPGSTSLLFGRVAAVGIM